MKISKIIILVLLALILGISAAGIFFFHPKPEPEQIFRANLTDAQKMLVMLRRVEAAHQQSTNGYRHISAKRNGGEMIYSEGWKAMNLPEAEVRTGFDYECLPLEGVCQAIETGKNGPVGNGIRINIETGVYTCLGSYKPVTTEGFDGALVTVACQA